MKVKDLIELLLSCDKELDVVNANYEDAIVVKEQTVHSIRNEKKSSTKYAIVEFSAE